jgi:Cyclin, N-terminal domain
MGFREIDDLDREVVLNYVLEMLKKTVSENDVIRRRQSSTATLPRLNSVDEKLFFDDEDVSVTRSRGSCAALQTLFERISHPGFKVRNLTIVIALSYMDKFANILHIYCNSLTVRKLFAGCLIIASKTHQNEVSREKLAEAMEISINDMVNVESAIVMAVRDLTVHPQALINYVKPLLGTRPAPAVSNSGYYGAPTPTAQSFPTLQHGGSATQGQGGSYPQQYPPAASTYNQNQYNPGFPQ